MCESPQFLRSCDLQSLCHSTSQNGPYFPFGPADWALVCFDLQLALLRKNGLLKALDNVTPEPVVTMRRVAGLSHDAVMLGGE